MLNGPKNNQPLGLQEYLLLASYPFMKASLVPLLQPLAKIGLEQQVSTVKVRLSFSETAWRIYTTRGLLGFYDGTLVSMAREGFKGTYKGPLQFIANDFSRQFIPVDYHWSALWRGMVAGSMVGFLDSLFAGLLERYKVYRITQNEPGNFHRFCLTVYSQQTGGSCLPRLNGFVQEMYRGLGVTIAKQTVMNVAFFTTKSWVDKTSQPYQSHYPASSMVLNALVPGISAALVGAPLDAIKTLSQHNTGKKKLFKLLTSIVKTSGWTGLFAGIQSRFGLITVGYSLNAGFLTWFERIRSKPVSLSQKNAEPDISALTERFNALSIHKLKPPTEEPNANLLIVKEAAHLGTLTRKQPLSHEEDLLVKRGLRPKS